MLQITLVSLSYNYQQTKKTNFFRVSHYNHVREKRKYKKINISQKQNNKNPQKSKFSQSLTYNTKENSPRRIVTLIDDHGIRDENSNNFRPFRNASAPKHRFDSTVPRRVTATKYSAPAFLAYVNHSFFSSYCLTTNLAPTFAWLIPTREVTLIKRNLRGPCFCVRSNVADPTDVYQLYTFVFRFCFELRNSFVLSGLIAWLCR